MRSRCRAAAEPAPDCSPCSNASRTRQDSLPVFMHEATVLGSRPNADAAPLFPFVPHQFVQQRHQPQVVNVLHGPALLDDRLTLSHASSLSEQLAPS